MTDRPADWVAQACADLGTDAVVDWCAGLLSGRPVDDGPSLDLIGGPGATLLVMQDAAVPGGLDHWARIWAARALRYAWNDGPQCAPGGRRRARRPGVAGP